MLLNLGYGECIIREISPNLLALEGQIPIVVF